MDLDNLRPFNDHLSVHAYSLTCKARDIPSLQPRAIIHQNINNLHFKRSSHPAIYPERSCKLHLLAAS
jgi:hypothetical protein